MSEDLGKKFFPLTSLMSIVAMANSHFSLTDLENDAILTKKIKLICYINLQKKIQSKLTLAPVYLVPHQVRTVYQYMYILN